MDKSVGYNPNGTTDDAIYGRIDVLCAFDTIIDTKIDAKQMG